MPTIKCGFEDSAHGAGKDLLVIFGPTVRVDIGFDSAWNVQSKNAPDAGMKSLPALIDTGATESCIDSLLAAKLNLPIVNRRKTAGAHGAKEVNMHLAQIHIPELPYTIYGEFAAVDLIAGGQQHHALLGRTFLRNFTMTFDGRTGQVTLSRPEEKPRPEPGQ